MLSVVPPSQSIAVKALLDEGVNHHERGDFDRAEQCYRRALRREPDHPLALGLLGALSHQRGQNERALELIDKSIAGDADEAMHHHNRGTTLYALGRFDEAIEAYLQATDNHPGYALAYHSLYAAYLELARHSEAVYAVKLAAKYSGADTDSRHAANIHTSLIFALDSSAETTADEIVDARREFNDRFCEPYRSAWPDHPNDPDPDRQLRVGYVGADFYHHSASTGFGSVLLNCDKSKYHVTIYSGTEKPDALTATFKRSADRWHDIRRWTDEALAEHIVNNRIDVLVDLSAFTAGGRLFTFARKPAPVQVTGWGYATGTGMAAMDAMISDAVVAPPEHDWQVSEQVIRLSSVIGLTLLPDDPMHGVDTGSVRSALGRRPTFGLFNRQTKINAGMFDTVAAILKRVPDSRVLIKNGRLQSPALQAYTRKLFAERGIEERQVGLIGVTSREEHLRWHNIVDVMLDPFPQCGGVSALESLWMGVPYVAVLGDRATTRVSASFLHQLGLSDWVVPDAEAYVERAVQAMADKKTLIRLRESLRPSMLDLPMADGPSYAREVEEAYRRLWVDWTAKKQGAQA